MKIIIIKEIQTEHDLTFEASSVLLCEDEFLDEELHELKEDENKNSRYSYEVKDYEGYKTLVSIKIL